MMMPAANHPICCHDGIRVWKWVSIVAILAPFGGPG